MNITFLGKKILSKAFQSLPKETHDRFKLHHTDHQKIHDAIEKSDIIIIEERNPISIIKQLSDFHLSASIILFFNSALSLSDYEDYFDENIILINGIANASVNQQAGLIALLSNKELTDEQNESLETFFDPLGNVLWLDDDIQYDGFRAITTSLFKTHLKTLQQYAKITEKFGFTEEECYEILALTDLSLNTLLVENESEHPQFSDISQLLLDPNDFSDENAEKDCLLFEEDVDLICKNHEKQRTQFKEGAEH